MIEFRKDRYYWVRFKFTPTLHMARPNTIHGNVVESWYLPWYDRISPIKADRLEVLEEVPLPEGYR